jgi:hypothetical protein
MNQPITTKIFATRDEANTTLDAPPDVVQVTFNGIPAEKTDNVAAPSIQVQKAALTRKSDTDNDSIFLPAGFVFRYRPAVGNCIGDWVTEVEVTTGQSIEVSSLFASVTISCMEDGSSVNDLTCGTATVEFVKRILPALLLTLYSRSLLLRVNKLIIVFFLRPDGRNFGRYALDVTQTTATISV